MLLTLKKLCEEALREKYNEPEKFLEITKPQIISVGSDQSLEWFELGLRDALQVSTVLTNKISNINFFHFTIPFPCLTYPFAKYRISFIKEELATTDHPVHTT